MCGYPEPCGADTIIVPLLFLFSAEEVRALASLSKLFKVRQLESSGTRFKSKPPGLQA